MGKTTGKRTYHHGDLRSALLQAAVELIGERGLGGWSLRECARHAGVSHAAPYRHFEDRDALVHAIAEEGFELLVERAEVAMAAHDDPLDRLDAYGVAYVLFAVAQPVHFRAMFTSDVKRGWPSPEGNRAFDLLLGSAAVATDSPPTSEDAIATALAAWSLPHGLAMLILDGRVPESSVQTEAQVEALAVDALARWRGPLLSSAARRTR